MPTYLRKFYVKQLLQTKKLEKEAIEKQNKKSSTITKPKFK
tara:strand:- start:543 stop:665 length:123 start_codon:yes stop_codon:yes gene_type:complete